MRIILHGGYSGNWEQAGEDYLLFRKLVSAAEKEDGKVMVSICAYETPEAFPHLEQLKNTFHELNPAIKLTIAGRNSFKENISQHKVVFLQGGNSSAHKKFMDTIDAEEIYKGKSLIAGSSSGAMLLCKHGYSRSSNGVFAGKGIVDLALIPHANAWPIQDCLPLLQKETSSSILLLNEMQVVELQL